MDLATAPVHRCKVRLPRGGYGDERVVMNRTPNVLVAVVDNIEFPLEPGLNAVPAFIVPFAVKQHPIPGTMHLDGSVRSFIAVPGISPDDECTMLPPHLFGGVKGKDLFDRTLETGKPLDPKKFQSETLPRSSMPGVDVSSRGEVSRVLGDEHGITGPQVFQ